MQKESKTFLKAIVLAVIALSLIEAGRQFAIKRDLSPEKIPTVSKIDTLLTRDAEDHFFVDSFKDMQEELASAQEEGKAGIFIFFDMQGCPYCKYMKENVLNRIDVQDVYTKNFRNISIDIYAQTEAVDMDGTEMTEAEFAAKHGVNLTPTMIFFGLDGSELYRKPGFIKKPDEFIAMGMEVVEFTTP